MENIIERLLDSRTVIASVVQKAPDENFLQRLADFIQELCEKLEKKAFILPKEGNTEVSEVVLNYMKNRLHLFDHPQLTAAIGVTLRAVQKYLDSVANQMPSSMFESTLNFDSCCKFGFVVPGEGLFDRLTTLEGKVEKLASDMESLRSHIDTKMDEMKSEMKSVMKKEMKTLIERLINDRDERSQRKRKRSEDKDRAEERRSDDNIDDHEGEDEGERATLGSSTSPFPESTPQRSAAPKPLHSSSKSSTRVWQSVRKCSSTRSTPIAG